jgi:hypothetical protein
MKSDDRVAGKSPLYRYNGVYTGIMRFIPSSPPLYRSKGGDDGKKGVKRLP